MTVADSTSGSFNSDFYRHSLYFVNVLSPMIIVAAGSVAEICAILLHDGRRTYLFERAVVLVYPLLIPAVTAAGAMTLANGGSE